MFKEFRDFVLRGDLVDLAVGVVISAAFGIVVSAPVKDLITSIIAAVVKKSDLSWFFVKVNGAIFLYGNFFNAVISFLLIAATIHSLVVLPVNTLMSQIQKLATSGKKSAGNAKATSRFRLGVARSARRPLRNWSPA